MKRHLSKLELVKESKCRFCGEQYEIPTHLFSNHVALYSARALHLEAGEIEEGDVPNLGPSLILDFLKLMRICFFDSTEIIHKEFVLQ